MKVTPHSPPAGTEPFVKPTQPVPDSTTESPGSGFSALQHQPTSKTQTSRPTSSTEIPGSGSFAAKHKLTSKAKTSRLSSITEFPRTGSSAAKHQPISKTTTNRPTSPPASRPHSDRPSHTDPPVSSDPTDTGSPMLHRSRQDSIFSLSSEAGSDLSDQPPLDLYVEEGELSEVPDPTVTDQDQPMSEEQTYRETMRHLLIYGLVSYSRHGQCDQYF